MPKIEIKEDICKGCGLCVRICPKQAIRMSKTLNATGFHPAEFFGVCSGCKSCAVTCPDVAIVVYKEKKGGDRE